MHWLESKILLQIQLSSFYICCLDSNWFLIGHPSFATSNTNVFTKKAKVGLRSFRSEQLAAKLVETPSKLSTYTFIFSEHKSFSELTSHCNKGRCCRDTASMSLWNNFTLFWKLNIDWARSDAILSFPSRDKLIGLTHTQSCPSLVGTNWLD